MEYMDACIVYCMLYASQDFSADKPAPKQAGNRMRIRAEECSPVPKILCQSYKHC